MFHLLSQLSLQYEARGYLASRLHRWRERGDGDEAILRDVESVAGEMARRTDSELREMTVDWRRALRRRERAWPDLVGPAFAAVREAARRATGLFPYPVQVLAGAALVRGDFAEMATGEGKTLAILLPAYVFSLAGRGVHVSTVNSYLAERDAEFAAPVLELLGCSTALLPEQGDPQAKRQAYDADVTYGVGYEFGFDYLRDHLGAIQSERRKKVRSSIANALLDRSDDRRASRVQRPLAFAIVDEVDSVLIDEAGTPLLLSQAGSPDPEAEIPFRAARELARILEAGRDYEGPDSTGRFELTDAGRERVHRRGEFPAESLRRPWSVYVLNALKAEHALLRDRHYLVSDEEKVVIVDEFTGRPHPERTWREGLHQAVEAKEEVPVNPESEGAASITRQRYYREYPHLCGLTGTAVESEGEFFQFFDIGVTPIPPHRPCRRELRPDRIFPGEAARTAALVDEVGERHVEGQPVLVGTRTIEASETIADALREAGLNFRLLSAKHDQEENEIVSGAGRAGSIVIATNMAGRGTHIGLTPEAEAAGGLHVIAVERNESARIDRQLIGRAGRQGQPGGAQFFLCGDDYLLRTFLPVAAEQLAGLSQPEIDARNSFWAGRFLEAQRRAEVLRYRQRFSLHARDERLTQTRASLA